MSSDDPRKNYLDDGKINEFPNYAFPLGFEVKHQKRRPPNELIPMIYLSDDKTFIQFLIFYESLGDSHKLGAELFEHVQDEIDEISIAQEASQPSNSMVQSDDTRTTFDTDKSSLANPQSFPDIRSSVDFPDARNPQSFSDPEAIVVDDPLVKAPPPFQVKQVSSKLREAIFLSADTPQT
mmetsp:Transcript_15002/g.23232  ORF Transcript_15002/g.23232 Transcript_15002/m.23232 type:complete len:180 (+) Transcript_15002:322-861(+)